MSIEQTQREINQLDKDIAALEKKRADFEQKEVDRMQKINSIKRSITKNTSSSMFSSKARQMQGYQNEIARYLKDKADLTKKIADKRKSRADKMLKLQREEKSEREKVDRIQKSLQQDYKHRIDELTAQVRNQFVVSSQDFSTAVPYTEALSREEYDVFISHAWEDKEDFVDELVTELTQLDVKVWYDKRKIVWGDSMRAKIDDGLKKSKYGIVIISPNYIAEGKYWTKTELDGLFQIESVNGKTILPIWHNITKKEVMEYSPIIAGKLAMNTTSMTPKEIAYELVNYVLKQQEQPQ